LTHPGDAPRGHATLLFVRPNVAPCKRALASIWQEFPGLELALVFGSVAREQATEESDLDIAVVGKNIDVLELTRQAER